MLGKSNLKQNEIGKDKMPLIDGKTMANLYDQLKNIFLDNNSLDSKILKTMALVNYRENTLYNSGNSVLEEMAFIHDQNPNPVLRVNLSGAVIYANSASRELLKYWRAAGSNHLDPEVISLFQETLSNKTTTNLEIALGNKYFLITILPLITDNCVNIYGLDITNQRLSQNDIIRSEKLSALCQLAGGFAHEFNNILANIQMNLDLTCLEQKRGIYDVPDPFMVLINKINQQVRRAKELVYNVMDFAELREPIKNSVSICELLRSVIDKQRNVLQQENIEVSEDFLATQKLNVDKYQMEQALYQLVLNARQAMEPHKKGELRLSSRDFKEYVALEIWDDGIGIKKEHLDKVFNPFFTTKGAFAQDEFGIPGIGLGLSLVYQIIAQHKGTICIESSPEHGTLVKILLPV
ncbi:MAG: HAMP domain-containing histidine kinase [Spirochaetales bacterium]|nr:HAMP domain-containing histidine kinase [Spirochaetales bacterium]